MRASIAICLLLVAQLAAGADETTEERPDFSGSWELNQSRSDDPRVKLAAGMGDSASGQRGGGAVRNRPRRGDREQPVDERQALLGLAAVLEAVPRMISLKHEEPEMTLIGALREGAGYRASILTDGRAFAHRTAPGTTVQGTAVWRLGGRLALEFPVGSRTAEEIWELVAEGSRILVTTRLPRKGLLPAVQVLRIYDRVEIVPWDVPD